MSASIGMSQFKDLDSFIKIRKENRKKIINEFSENMKIKNKINFIKEKYNVNASWFGLPIILSKSIDKQKFLKKLEKNGVETRPIISGNFLKQPAIKKYNLTCKNKMKNADYINEKGFFIGLPTKKIPNKLIKKLVRVFEKSV